MRKRMTSLLLTLVMLLSLVPAMGVTASAADDTSYDPGSVRNYVSFASQLESTTSRDLVLENDFELLYHRGVSISPSLSGVRQNMAQQPRPLFQGRHEAGDRGD
ncbi:hypothetical protein, partial [Oscillibacter sp. MSJ-31]|uniref:hypothetical protein n=1 Tax=Oscillibacter sp. MSJ-31 TaxID=2841526 RepID=UPI001C11AD4F